MFPSKRKMIAVGACALLLAGAYVMLSPSRAPAWVNGAPRDDSLGYAAAFAAELAKIGQISPQEFARRYGSEAKYLAKISWDPTSAKFWDDFNRDPAQTPPSKRHGAFDFRLNADELAKFKENGFVVSERLGAASFAEMFYRIYSRDLPVFISSDALLHAWHRSYDAVLEELEETYLADSLEEILAGMAQSIPAAQAEYGQGILGDSLADADYFLAVARSLLAGKQAGTSLGQEARTAKTLHAIERLGMEKFILFGRERDMDFSQFKVRGHYENSEQLKRYFKAMMWCGRIDMRVAGGEDYFGTLSSPRELGSAIVLHDLLRRANKFEPWRQFDQLLQTFVGRTDSATFAHLAVLLDEAGIRTPADVNTIERLEALQSEILAGKFGLQAIRGDLYTSPFGADKQVVLPRSFTLLGQKFVVDSWVTAKVVFDDVLWDGRKVFRRVPSCLDVAFSAFANNQVVPLLVERMTEGPHPRRDQLNYQHHLAGYVEPVPHFWSRLEKMAQRAAVLLEKTPFPNRPVTQAASKKQQLWDQGRGRQNQVAFFRNFAKQVGTIKVIAGKQLEQKELTKEETTFLEDVVQIQRGSGMTRYNGWYPGLFYKGREDCGKWDALVADVHTDPPDVTGPGCVLHQGVGNVDFLLIAIDNGKDRMVYAGPVLSHYEFEVTGPVRKSDSEWRSNINAGTLPPRPEWTRTYFVPGTNAAAKMYRYD